MDEIIEILEEINPDPDYRTAENLMDGEILDSFCILAIISELEDTFDIDIPTAEIKPANFNSARAIYEMVKRLQG